MPYVKPTEAELSGPGAAGSAEPAPEPAPADAANLAREVEALKRERERLVAERGRVLERLAVRVLEIDAAAGRLYDYDPDRVEVGSQADAQALIDRTRR